MRQSLTAVILVLALAHPSAPSGQVETQRGDTFSRQSQTTAFPKVAGGDGEQRAFVDSALERFASAGLSLHWIGVDHYEDEVPADRSVPWRYVLEAPSHEANVVVQGDSPLPYGRIVLLVEVAGLEEAVVHWVDTGRGPAGRARASESLVILSNDLQGRFAENLLAHELAHLLTVGNGHNQRWCREYRRIGEALSPEVQQVLESHLEIREGYCEFDTAPQHPSLN